MRKAVRGLAALGILAATIGLTATPASADGDAITVDPGAVSVTLQLGQTRQVALSLSNPTDTDATVSLDGASSAVAPTAAPASAPASARTATPAVTIPTETTAHMLAGKELTSAAPAPATADGWKSQAALPTATMDNAVGVYKGKVYSVGGVVGSGFLAHSTAAGYVYDQASDSWSSLPDLPDYQGHSGFREKPAGAFIDGTFYVTGGWMHDGSAEGSTLAYQPGAASWTNVATNQVPYAAAGTAVLNGKLYQVGGCRSTCGSTDVRVFDPVAKSWSSTAAYPQRTSWTSCGAVAGKLYCAGGAVDSPNGLQSSRAAYAYDPDTDSWTRMADMPESLWASAYTAAAGRLVVSGGSTGSSTATGVTNAGYAYNVATDTWSAISAAPKALYRSGSVCGMYTVGGSVSKITPVADTSQLTGYGTCSDYVPWLSVSPKRVTVPAHGSATVTVSVDTSKLDQPRSQTAALDITSSLAGTTPPVPVSLNATPPPSWGLLTGTVSGKNCAGTVAPLGDATVEVDWDTDGMVLRTNASGEYRRWIDTAKNPLTMLATSDGWRAQMRSVSLTAGATSTQKFTLDTYPSCK
ncbi:Kelch repeat-containing protein [Streptomyces sp. NPDC056910]|uniref:Kelch repeat-containing protein n=1 Tax=Streptomyces sp. NPDC056910 TaxID=3345964 RepID=UPI00369C3C84